MQRGCVWAHICTKALFRPCDLNMLGWREMAAAHCCLERCYFCWCHLPMWSVPSRERACCLTFFLFRKDHLSSPPVPYEKLQELLEVVLKRCADLSPPQSSKKHAVSQELCLLLGPGRVGMIILAQHGDVVYMFHTLTCGFGGLWCFFSSSFLDKLTIFVSEGAEDGCW